MSGQLLLPLAGDLSRDDQRGRVVGSIASGILVGILLSRTVSGFVAEHFGWRAIYVLASAATAILAVVVAAKLPRDTERHGGMSYPRLLASIVTTVTAHRAIGVTLFIGACSFGVFTMFWTGLTFLLRSPPFSYSLARIGLVGLVGLAGALAARQAGRLHDLGWSSRATGAALVLALASLALAAAGARSIVLLLAAVLLVDVAIQGIAILNQTRLFSLAAQARSRVNTAYVVCNFTGGAIGSLLAGTLWDIAGWHALVGGQVAVVVSALSAWTLNRATLASADVRRR
ncbi:hypothetical protein GCM10011390_21350 [Aureimonas endophytica]|uniref:Major facilitator superfamily (MFS) profile domain-containing protein n=1 Tax=Aureimonas endophytica TaxID=2027858 RepID=A0A917E3T9_9HYPH|nr:hypothetical protein GCM10011390_21350 [Aureimonas endophytica]